MAFHVFCGKNFNLAEWSASAACGECPRHSWWDLTQALCAELHEPSDSRVDFGAKLRATLLGSPPQTWAWAIQEARCLRPGDVAYCTGELPGLAIADACGRRAPGARVAIFVHNIMTVRKLLALKLLRLSRSVALWISNAQPQIEFLHSRVGIPAERLLCVCEQTDTRFFSPGPSNTSKTRPIVASTGLEQRDYTTLAEATATMDVDVKITGFSKDAAINRRTFPAKFPANMDSRFYSWRDLAQLYRDADVVAVTLHPNRMCAGLTAVMEAMASARPVVLTLTDGLRSYFADGEAVRCVRPHKPEALRAAIQDLLHRPRAAAALAQRGYEYARVKFATERWVESISAALGSLQTGGGDAAQQICAHPKPSSPRAPDS